MKNVCTRGVVLVAVAVLSCDSSHAQNDLDQKIDRNIDDWVATYKHMHEYPELSTQEKETSALIASSLRKLGYDVTDHFGQYEEPDLTSYGVVASELVVFLQTIVSREVDPQQPTVVTVGSFHAGTKHNIIPADAHLQLTVRTMTPEQREKVLAAIKRATNGIAEAAGIPSDHATIIEVAKDAVPATINDPALSRRMGAALEKALGKDNVVQGKPLMASEDFSLFALADPKPPTMMFWLGAVDPAKVKESQEKGTRLPSLHSSEFQPLPEPTIRTGVKALTTAVMELLRK